MKLLSPGRLAALVAAGAVAAGALVSATPVNAAGGTGNLAYTCPVEGFNLKLTFQMDTDAGPTAYVSKAIAPKLTVSTTLNKDLMNFVRAFGVRAFAGKLETTVFQNGAPVVVRSEIKKVNVPPAGQSLRLAAVGPLPRKALGSPGSLTYKPGNIKFSVTAYREDGSVFIALDDLSCTKDASNPASRTVDTVRFVKSPTRTTPVVGYAKAAKKVTAVARVTATSGVAPSGKVTFSLFKGKAKVRSVTVGVSGGKAVAAFTGVRAKGAYKVVATYGGSVALKGSTASRALTVR